MSELSPIELPSSVAAELRKLSARQVSALVTLGDAAYNMIGLAALTGNAEESEDVAKSVTTIWEKVDDAKSALRAYRQLVLSTYLAPVDERWREARWGLIGDQVIEIRD